MLRHFSGPDNVPWVTPPAISVSVYYPTMSATYDTTDEFYENLAVIISASPSMDNLFSWATSMPEWAHITIRGHPALNSLAWVKWTRMDSDCSSCAFTMTCASSTPTSGRSPSTRFPGDTRAQRIGTNWIWSYSGVPLSRTFYTHALTAVRIVTQTTPRCVASSGCNQRSYIALRNRWTPVLMSARCHNHTSCHNLRRLLRESSVPHNPKVLPQRCVKDTMHHTALAFGKNTSKTNEWFDAKLSEMSRVIKAKQQRPD